MLENVTIQETPEEILRQVGLFAGVKDSPEAMKLVTAMMKKKSFGAGHVLIEQGTSGQEFFVLTKGSVAISKKTAEGDGYKVVVLNHQNHPAFGEGGLMDDEVRSATIVCESAVECLVLSKTDFDAFCSRSPQYALPIFKKIAISLMSRLNQTSNDLMLLHKALMDEIRNS